MVRAVVFACDVRKMVVLYFGKRAFQARIKLHCAIEKFKKKRFWYRLNT
jgi:hypothetical protein